MMRPQLMAILNLTPDSFSGDGIMDVPQSVQRFSTLAQEGADSVDLGAESTRPGATPLTDEAEWERLAPVLSALANTPLRTRARLSIDTRHAANAEKALAMGANMLNDVGGLRDASMRAVLREKSCDIVVMHALTVPADRAVTLPSGTDPVRCILAWKDDVTALAQEAGIDPARLIFDPGIGFGKNPAQSRVLVERAAELVASGGRWLYGHSRKSFLGGSDPGAQTLKYSRQLAEVGVAMLRVHDIAAHVQLFGRA